MVLAMFREGRCSWPGSEEWFATIDRCTYDDVSTPESIKTARWYTSKPPLMEVIMYSVAWPICKVFGWDFKEKFDVVGRAVIILFNVVPLALMLMFFGRWLYQLGARGFVYGYCLAAAAGGTYLTGWSVTLNNHVPAAFCVFFAYYLLYDISQRTDAGWGRFAMAGFLGSLAFTLETPALLFAAFSGVLLCACDWRRTLLAFGPAMLVPIVAFLVSNKLCIGQWFPFQWSFPLHYDPYWQTPREMDSLMEPKLVYLFNLTFGHHGWFLLTPIFIIALVGIFRNLVDNRSELQWLAMVMLIISAAVLGFYVWKTNNYGGTTQGPRWLFWLIPMWLVMLPAGVEWFVRRAVGRWLSIVFLAVSVFSMAYSMNIPWQRSWIHEIAFRCGFIHF